MDLESIISQKSGQLSCRGEASGDGGDSGGEYGRRRVLRGPGAGSCRGDRVLLEELRVANLTLYDEAQK